MAGEPSSLEQAVSRALRENLGSVQRTADDLRQAVDDLVASCSSSRPANAVPALLRAQTAAASLAASLDVLTRFVAGSLQPAPVVALQEAVTRAVEVPQPAPVRAPRPLTPTPMAETAEAAREMVSEGAPPPPPASVVEEIPLPREVPFAAEPEPVAAPAPAAEFDVANLSADEQELHRRANRAAKVSMQDIKLIRPKELKEARANKDICKRLHDDIDKARKEYERRFKPILGHPVDYFYKWMVDILAEGDPEALGDYPYPSPILRR